MKWPWQKEVQKKSQYQDVLRRLIASQSGVLSGTVSPENCMRSPTVMAIVTAVSRRMAVTPCHVYEKTFDEKTGKERKRAQPGHSVSRLLRRPNSWQSNYEFWQDATSTMLRWGRFHAYKQRSSTGPILELIPLNPRAVQLEQESDFSIKYRVQLQGGQTAVYEQREIFSARGAARDFVCGDSPIEDVKTTVALEILSEQFGANFFQNGALPLLIFSYMEGSDGFETEEQEKQFLDDMKEAFGGNNMLTTALLPKGINKPEPIHLDLQGMQMIESRKYQRTVIAGAFGVPPHLVGDLERGTFNNVEQQDKDFTQNVVLPVAKAFEAAMERDLLTPQDRNDGLVIRFNLDSILRASFKDRQEGLRIQREMGIISADEWREIEGRNPRDDEYGDDYMHPSNMVVDGEEPDEPQPTDSPPGTEEPE